MREWITAIASSITAIGVLILWFQFLLLSKQIVEDHIRSRNEMAINLMLNWVGKLERETSAARKLAEKLDPNQALRLWKEETLELGKENQASVETCLAHSGLSCETQGDKLILQVPAVSLIRWQVVRYLNSLESMLSAWRHNVATKNILEEELRYVFDETQGHTGLLNIRKAAGTTAFPAIAEFEKAVEHLKNPPPGSPPTGEGKISAWSILFKLR